MKLRRKVLLFFDGRWAYDSGASLADDKFTLVLLWTSGTIAAILMYLSGQRRSLIEVDIGRRQLVLICILTGLTVAFYNWAWIRRAKSADSLDVLKPWYSRRIDREHYIDKTGLTLCQFATNLLGMNILVIIWTAGNVGFPVQLTDDLSNAVTNVDNSFNLYHIWIVFSLTAIIRIYWCNRRARLN